MRVFSYSESTEHEVHFVLCELPFMLIDFQMMLEKNQWLIASTRNTSPLHLYSAKTETWLRKDVYLYICVSIHATYLVPNYTS